MATTRSTCAEPQFRELWIRHGRSQVRVWSKLPSKRVRGAGPSPAGCPCMQQHRGLIISGPRRRLCVTHERWEPIAWSSSHVGSELNEPSATMTMDRNGSGYLPLSEVARKLGKSVDTAKRRLREGAFPGAIRASAAPNAPWLVPIDDLQGGRNVAQPVGSKMTGGGPTSSCGPTGHSEVVQSLIAVVAHQAEEIAHLRNELSLASARAEAGDHQRSDRSAR